MRRLLRGIRTATWLGVAVLMGLWVWGRLARTAPPARPVPSGFTALGGTPAPPFTLTDQFGQPVALRSLRGKVVVLAFVDSECTTICPLTAEVMRGAQTLLGPGARGVDLLAVNVNPLHRSVADVRRWSAQHGMLHRWRFLTGSLARLRRVWRAYHVWTAVVEGQVDHEPAVYVIDPRGREQLLTLTASDPSRRSLQQQAQTLAEAVDRYLPRPVPLRAAPPPPEPPVAGGSFTLPLLRPAGATVSVGRGSGSRAPVLVDFFATWCHACSQDLAVLDRYQALRRHRPGLPSVVAVDFFLAEPGGTWVRRFVAQHHVGVPVALDRTGAVGDRYGVTALPALYLVSPQGTILWRHTGLVSLSDLLQAVAHP